MMLKVVKIDNIAHAKRTNWITCSRACTHENRRRNDVVRLARDDPLSDTGRSLFAGHDSRREIHVRY
jgi:hypothetical protein